MRPLFEACKLLIQTHARRLPLIDTDDQTGKEVVLSVLTQYRVLKFMAVNVGPSIEKAGISESSTDAPSRCDTYVCPSVVPRDDPSGPDASFAEHRNLLQPFTGTR
jgi:hypothetical protein